MPSNHNRKFKILDKVKIISKNLLGEVVASWMTFPEMNTEYGVETVNGIMTVLEENDL